MPDTSNNPLVVLAQRGDTKAFAALVERHYRMVHGLVFSKVSEWSVAEDIAQDVFLIAWSNLARLKHPEAFLVWLRQIARNSALNWIRKQQYRRALADRHNEQTDPSTEQEDPAWAAERNECIEHIGEALRSLSPKLRDAMVLYYMEGKTAAECAAALGISVDTMKKRLRLGRRRMQEFFERIAERDLHQLLPQKPRRQIEHILAGLAFGPIMPDLGHAAAAAGPAMWLADIAHGASLKVTGAALLKSSGGVLTLAKAATAATAIAAVGAGAGTVLVMRPPSGPGTVSPVVVAMAAQAGAMAPAHDGMEATISRDGSGIALTETRFILVEQDYAGLGAANGLRKNDRIVEVNGRPIAMNIKEDPRAYLYGLPGTTVRVTVMRPGAAGKETRVELDIQTPYDPNRFADPIQ